MTPRWTLPLILLVVIATPSAVAQRTRLARAPRFSASYYFDGRLGPLAAGRDGSVWFTGSSLGRISAAGEMTVLAKNVPFSVARVTFDGRLCGVLLRDGSYGVRCYSATGEFEDVAGFDGTRIGDIVDTADGTLWASQANKVVGVSRAGFVTEINVTSPYPGGLAVDASGSVWLSLPKSVVRVLPGGAIDEFEADEVFAKRGGAGAFDGGVAVTEGGVWLAIGGEPRTSSYRQPSQIVRLSPERSFTVYNQTFATWPRHLTAAPDGSIWYINSTEFAAVLREDSLGHTRADGSFESVAIPNSAPWGWWGYQATGIAVDTSGAVWVGITQDGYHSLVIRLVTAIQ